jgi:small subunit ribosomal protein S6
VRVDELEEGPSAMLQKRDRDDDRSDRPGGRPDRGGFGRGDRDSRPPRRF